MRIVLATRNRAKGAEMARLLEPLPDGVELVVLADYAGAPEVEEDGETFAANALIKARAAASYCACWAVADDSGLTVDHLGGEPGVLSARYSGAHGDDAANNRLVLAKLAGVEPGRRAAKFVAAVALVGPDGREWVVEGECGGQIAFEPRGEGGFGYDSIFLRPELGRTFAELAAEEKDALSHRGAAFGRLRELLGEVAGERG